MLLVNDEFVKNLVDMIYISFTELYEKVIDALQLEQIQCPHCKQYGFCHHCYYSRHLKRKLRENEDEKILILRIKCKHCGKTHAVLLSSMIPYTQLSLEDTVLIIGEAEQKDENERKQLQNELYEREWIGPEDPVNVMKRYRTFWKQRLISEAISLNDDNLSEKCIQAFRRQFMQIHCGCIFQYPFST